MRMASVTRTRCCRGYIIDCDAKVAGCALGVAVCRIDVSDVRCVGTQASEAQPNLASVASSCFRFQLVIISGRPCVLGSEQSPEDRMVIFIYKN